MERKLIPYRLALALLIVCLLGPWAPDAVESFVLRRRSVPLEEEDVLLPESQRDDNELSDDMDDVGGFAGAVGAPDDDDDDDQVGEWFASEPADDADDEEIAEQVMNAVRSQLPESYAEDFNEDVEGDMGFHDRDDDESKTDEDFPDDEDEDEEKSDGKMPLDKDDLDQLFKMAAEQEEKEAVTPIMEQLAEAEKKELSKNEVEQLFEKVADNELKKTIEDASLKEPNASSDIVVVPTSEVATALSVEQLVKNVAGDSDDAVGVVNVKEEKIWPEEGKKMTKEWTMELEQPELVEDGVEETMWSGGRKFKRSPDDLVDDGPAKQNAVELLKAYIELQEEENRHLTEALNLATLAQTERTDRYVGPQVEQLRLAVGDEEAIQAIRQMIRADEDADNDDGEDSDESDDTEDERNEVEMVEKRRLPPIEEEEEEDDEEEEEEAEDGQEGDDEDAELPSTLLKDKFVKDRLRQYVLNKELDTIRNAIERDEEGDDETDEYLPRPPPPNKNIFNDPRLNPFTRDIEYIYRHRGSKPINKRYSAADQFELVDKPEWDSEGEQRAELISELRDALQQSEEGGFADSVTEADSCPAVQELTDDCQAAREQGLSLDAEAMELCNRHQLCYACGPVFGMTADTCDRGYLAEADLLCSRPDDEGYGPARCRGEAAGLFGIMLRGHRFVDSPGFSPSICHDRCAYDFVVGVATKR